MLYWLVLLAGFVLVAGLQSAEPARVRFEGACVSVTVANAPLREVIAEWARAGQVKVTGGDLLPNRPVTVSADCIDERRVLDVILEGTDRILVPREIETAGVSRFAGLLMLSGESS